MDSSEKKKLKLYYASKGIDVMFLSDADTASRLESDAIRFLKEEEKNWIRPSTSVKEITKARDVPENWREAFVWGTDDEISPLQFLNDPKNDPEYETYLRLKQKFEKDGK